MEEQPNEKEPLLVMSNLRERGWSPSMVAKLLGNVDCTKPNPHYRNAAPMRLWKQSRVEQAEASPVFAELSEKAKRGVDGNTLGISGSTNGSSALSPLFAAAAGSQLAFQFNYVTSDGRGFPDYGYAELLDSTKQVVSVLFTARTTPSGNTVPGYGMPAPDAIITPATNPIIVGAPSFSPLGLSSGTCWDAGCGYTGWISANYTIANAGSYYLLIGAANLNDTLYDTALAFAGATIAGTPIEDVVPIPAAIWLVGSGLAGVFGFARRKAGIGTQV